MKGENTYEIDFLQVVIIAMIVTMHSESSERSHLSLMSGLLSEASSLTQFHCVFSCRPVRVDATRNADSDGGGGHEVSFV